MAVVAEIWAGRRMDQNGGTGVVSVAAWLAGMQW